MRLPCSVFIVKPYMAIAIDAGDVHVSAVALYCVHADTILPPDSPPHTSTVLLSTSVMPYWSRACDIDASVRVVFVAVLYTTNDASVQSATAMTFNTHVHVY